MSQTLSHEQLVSSAAPTTATQAGVHVARRFTSSGQDPLDGVKWEKRKTVIANPDGSTIRKSECLTAIYAGGNINFVRHFFEDPTIAATSCARCCNYFS